MGGKRWSAAAAAASKSKPKGAATTSAASLSAPSVDGGRASAGSALQANGRKRGRSDSNGVPDSRTRRTSRERVGALKTAAARSKRGKVTLAAKRANASARASGRSKAKPPPSSHQPRKNRRTEASASLDLPATRGKSGSTRASAASTTASAGASSPSAAAAAAPKAVRPSVVAMPTDIQHGAAVGAHHLDATVTLLHRYLPFMDSPEERTRQRTAIATSASSRTTAGDDHYPWNSREAHGVSVFLAYAQYHVVRHLCQRLAQLTTATEPAFLAAAALGDAALMSPSPPDPTASLSGSSTNDEGSSMSDPLVFRQEQAYRTLRATVAASCTLGHRSCQVLWGPRGSGKHHILRLLAQEVRRTANTFVIELHGRLLKDDAAALRVIAQQLLQFLQSPQSSELRAAHYLLRSGSFGFGQLFRFERYLQEAATADAATEVDEDGVAPPAYAHRRAVRSDEDGTDEEVDGVDEFVITSTTTYLTGGAASGLPHLQRALLLLKNQGCSMVVCIRDIDVFGIRCDQLLYVLSGLMHDSDSDRGGVGGGSRAGLSLVLASAAPDIRNLEKRLSSRLTCETRYVPLLPWSPRNLLAATLYTTAQDALLQTKVREVSKQRMETVSKLRAGAVELRRGTERRGRVKAQEQARLKEYMAMHEALLHAKDAALRDLRARQRHLHAQLDSTVALSEATGAGSLATKLGFLSPSGWREGSAPSLTSPVSSPPLAHPSLSSGRTDAWMISTLLGHTSLTLEVQGVMCEELLRQLRRSTGAGKLCSVDDASPGQHGVATATLVQLVTDVSSELEVDGGISATALSALAAVLCRAASGSVDFLGSSGRRVLVEWLQMRLQHEPQPPLPPPTFLADPSASKLAYPDGVPQKILSDWREATYSMALSEPTTLPCSDGFADSHSTLRNLFARTEETGKRMDEVMTRSCTRPPSSLSQLSLLPPQLHDLLSSGQLVAMGYGSREAFLILLYMHLHHTTGVPQRTVADLLEDVSSSLGTSAAAALDREAFRHAVRLLCRWKLLRSFDDFSPLVEVNGSDARLREFLVYMLAQKPAWCETELGLDAREMMRFRGLVL